MEYLKKFNHKILLFFIISVLFICGLNLTASAKTIVSDEDYTIYDTTWTKANVDYWVKYDNIVFGFGDRTTCFLKITDSDGEYINNLTRLKCQYVIDGDLYTVNQEYKGDVNKFSFGSVFSKEGQFFSRENDESYRYSDKELENIFKYSDPKFSGHANYQWTWNFHVTDIVYLYVWYENADGEEVASSFFPNGEHPMYDEDGNLLGIYDVEGNIVSNTSIDESGMIVEIDPITNEETALLTADMQRAGVVDTRSNGFGFTNFVGSFQEILMLAAIIILAVALFPLINGISSAIGNSFKNKKYKKRKK